MAFLGLHSLFGNSYIPGLEHIRSWTHGFGPIRLPAFFPMAYLLLVAQRGDLTWHSTPPASPTLGFAAMRALQPQRKMPSTSAERFSRINSAAASLCDFRHRAVRPGSRHAGVRCAVSRLEPFAYALRWQSRYPLSWHLKTNAPDGCIRMTAALRPARSALNGHCTIHRSPPSFAVPRAPVEGRPRAGF